MSMQSLYGESIRLLDDARTLHGCCTDMIKYARTLHGFARICTDARTLHGRCTDISWCPSKPLPRSVLHLLKKFTAHSCTVYAGRHTCMLAWTWCRQWMSLCMERSHSQFTFWVTVNGLLFWFFITLHYVVFEEQLFPIDSAGARGSSPAQAQHLCRSRRELP